MSTRNRRVPVEQPPDEPAYSRRVPFVVQQMDARIYVCRAADDATVLSSDDPSSRAPKRRIGVLGVRRQIMLPRKPGGTASVEPEQDHIHVM